MYIYATSNALKLNTSPEFAPDLIRHCNPYAISPRPHTTSYATVENVTQSSLYVYVTQNALKLNTSLEFAPDLIRHCEYITHGR